VVVDALGGTAVVTTVGETEGTPVFRGVGLAVGETVGGDDVGVMVGGREVVGMLVGAVVGGGIH
jgi:hypothetical protein